MGDVIAASIAVFALGFVCALVLIRSQRSHEIAPRGPKADGVTLRLRALRRSRIGNLEARLAALEESIAKGSKAEGRSQFQADPDALQALLSLGYGRKEAAALLAATRGDTTAERVGAALRVVGASR